MAGHCLEVGSDKNPVLTRCESEQIGERKSIGSRRRHPVTIASWRLASARKRIIRQLRRERVCCRIRSNCIVTSGFVGRALLKAQHRIMRPNSLGGLPELKFSHDLDQGHTTSTSPSLRPRASQGSRISPAYELFCIYRTEASNGSNRVAIQWWLSSMLYPIGGSFRAKSARLWQTWHPTTLVRRTHLLPFELNS